MKVLVAVGMTGGHIIPGIAVAEELKAAESACEVVFAGTGRGRARDMVHRAGFDFFSLPVRGWTGMGAKGKLLFLFFIAVSLTGAFLLLLKEKPRVVVGTGSYAALPFAISALFLDIPLVLLEQNVVPGRVTRLLAPFARVVHVAYEETREYLSHRVRSIVSGNPIRRSFLVTRREDCLKEFGLDSGLKTVLVFGGSRGAHSINKAFVGAIPTFSRHPGLQFIVQTGEHDLRWVEVSCERAELKAAVISFIHEMGKAYACADLVVCRAGATTIAELTARGLPSILIPYPFSVGGHQKKNALLMKMAGASVVVEDSELAGGLFAEKIIRLLEEDSAFRTMAKAAEQLGKSDAGRSVAESVLSLGSRKCLER